MTGFCISLIFGFVVDAKIIIKFTGKEPCERRRLVWFEQNGIYLSLYFFIMIRAT